MRALAQTVLAVGLALGATLASCTPADHGPGAATEAAPDAAASTVATPDAADPSARPDAAPDGTPHDAAPPDASAPDAAAPDARAEPPAWPACDAVGPSPARRLTARQYQATVAQWLSVDVALSALPADPAAAPSQLAVEAWGRLAHAIADGVDPDALDLPCDLADAACRAHALPAFAARGFRRPPTDAERAWLGALWVAAEGDATQRLRHVIAALLQAPQVLYLAYPPARAGDGLRRLTPAELAARLAYAYWDAPPDAALAARPLDTDAQVQAAAVALAADPRFRGRVLRFVADWLGLDRLDTVAKATDAHPSFTPTLRAALAAGLSAFIEHAVFTQGRFADLFEGRSAQLTPATAALYGLPPTEGWRDLPAAERAGLLTRAGLLALLAGPTHPSAIQRGTFIQRRLLCQALPPPPPTVNNTPIEPPPGAAASLRALTDQRTAGPDCAGCHSLINPAGHLLGAYDAVGRFVPTEASGAPIDTSGAVPLSDLPDPLPDALALSAALAHSAQAQDCLAERWLEAVLARPLVPADRCSLRLLQQAFRDSGGDFAVLFATTATLPTVRWVPEGRE